MTESYKKYRPQSLDEVVGQDRAVAVLREALAEGQLPHCVLLSGPKGTGKTSLARILKRELGCADVDYHEVNAAADRGIDLAREVRATLYQAPLSGPCKVWYFDEAAQLSRRMGGDAQTALLKILEDTPPHVYFVLATTDPQELLPAVRDRCLPVPLVPIPERALAGLALAVAAKEMVPLSEEVAGALAAASEGSARKVLVLFDLVRHLPEPDRLGALADQDGRVRAIELCRLLLNPASKWPAVAKVLSSLDEDPEAVRRAVLGYARKILLSGGKQADRAYAILYAFEAPFHQSGAPGLARACYEVYRKE